MAINEIPVGLDPILLIDVAEDFDRNRPGQENEGEYSLSFGTGNLVLPLSISAYVIERGMKTLASQAINLEVSEDEGPALLKKLRETPEMTRVSFESLTVRSGVSKTQKLYQMWTATGISFPGTAPAPTRSATPPPAPARAA